MKTVFKGLIVVAVLALAACGDTGITTTGANSGVTVINGDGSDATITTPPVSTSGATSGVVITEGGGTLPICDGTSATAEAQGRCVAG